MDLCWCAVKDMTIWLAEEQNKKVRDKIDYIKSIKGKKDVENALKALAVSKLDDESYALLKYHIMEYKVSFTPIVSQVYGYKDKIEILWSIHKKSTLYPTVTAGALLG
jgi:hypothetical protein